MIEGVPCCNQDVAGGGRETSAGPAMPCLVRAATEALQEKLEQIGNSTSFMRSSSRPIDGGRCGASANKISTPLVSCWSVRRGRFLTISYVADDVAPGDIAAYRERAKAMASRAHKYFELIFSEVTRQ